ncbi:MAG TPA: hypothetical protein VK507_16125 [Iamia sp.]|nr:hypothetical protein [Iamia sp.]
MNDLDDRLSDLLTRSAAAVEVRPDVDAVLDGDAGDSPGAAVVDLGRRPRDGRRLLALAAAVVVALLAAGVVTTRDGGGSDPLDATAGGAALVYPVADHLPAAVADEAYIVTVSTQMATGEVRPIVPAARAVLGRRGSAGAQVGLATVQLGHPGSQPFDEVEGDDLTVAGRRAKVVQRDGTTSVVVEGDPVLEVDGPGDVVGLLQQIPDGGLVTGWDGEVPTLVLTGGTEVLVPPGPVVDGPSPTVIAGPEPADGPSVEVATQVDTPIAELADAGAVEPVDIGGVTGYVAAPEGGRVAWTTAEGTNVVVRVRGLGADDLLRVARSVRLVDEATWLESYDRHGPDLNPGNTVTLPPPTESEATAPTTTDPGTTATAGVSGGTHPLVGQPVHEIPGVTAEQAEGRGLVLGFSPAECAGCARLTVAIVDLTQPDWAPLGFAWDADGGIVAAAGAEDRLAAQDIDAPGLAAWSITDLPTTVVAGPDGIVRAVFVGGTTIDALEAALREAQAAAEG